MRFVSLSVLAFIAAPLAHADVENFLPVSLKCPMGGAGAMELVLKNGAGEAQRVTSNWDAKGISHLKVEASRDGKTFATKMDFNMRSPLSDHDQSYADKIVITVDSYLEQCKDGKVIGKFEREMARNRRQLKKVAKEEKKAAAAAKTDGGDEEASHAHSGE